jgi:hypothetical protein
MIDPTQTPTPSDPAVLTPTVAALPAAANDATVDAPATDPAEAEPAADAAPQGDADVVAAAKPAMKQGGQLTGGLTQGGFKPGSSNLRVPFN